MYQNSYSIDDIVIYSSNKQYSNNLNYHISQSESYVHPTANSPQGYHGQQQKPLIYSGNHHYTDDKTTTYYFTPQFFLKPSRRQTQFINTTEQVQALIEETFKTMLKKRLPKNISIHVCNTEELKQQHSRFGQWNDNIQGFAINKKILKQIFVKNNHLDSLLLTIGHEIGHIYINKLTNNTDEEAKAFAFAIEWAKTIKKHNIGNLAQNIKDDLDFKPARNGLHDIAFFFVKHLINKGLKPMQIHQDIIKGYKSLFGFYN